MSDNTLFLYCSALARDAALSALPSAAFTERHKTFGEFARELDRVLPYPERRGRSGQAKDISEGAGRSALLTQAARAAAPDELGNIAGSAHALAAAGKLIFAWKGVGLRPKHIIETAERLSSKKSEASRVASILRRLARLYELYEERLGSQWMDREARERELLQRLIPCKQMPARLLAPGDKIELIGFHRIPHFQRRLLDQLIRLGHEVVEKKNALRPHVVSFVDAPTPYAEIYDIGRRVYRWIAEDKIAPSEIAVAFRNLGSYSQAVSDVFTRLKIPFFERRGEPVTFQPVVRVALSAIDACADGFSRRALMRYLNAGPVDVAALAGASDAIDPSALNTLALDAGIESFHGAEAEEASASWRKRLDQFLQRKEKSSSIRRHRANAKVLLAVVERLERFRAKRSVASFALDWKSFFRWNEPLGARERVALRELNAAFDDVAQSPNAKSESVSLEEFRELLAAALEARSAHFGGTERSGVRVLNFYDLRGLSFRRVALGGMAEGICPARSGADPILGAGCEMEVRNALPLDHREYGQHLLPRLGIEIESEEKALFDCARASCAESLLLTRPLKDFDGSPLSASEYWLDLAAEKSVKESEHAAPIHPAPPLSECLTQEERELRAAWVLGGGIARDKNSSENELPAAVAEFANSERMRALAQSAAAEQNLLARAREKAQAQANPQDPQPPIPAPEPQQAARVASRLAPSGIGSPLLSPSDIENLAACSFKFFAEKICRLDRIEEPGEELSMLDAGSIWHSIFGDFYQEQIDLAHGRGEACARLDAAERGQYLDKLISLANRKFSETEGASFTGRPGFWNTQRARIEKVLSSWLDCELRPDRDGFFPALVEFSFGPDARTGARELEVALVENSKVPENILRIGGRMDRLDLKIETIGGKDTVVSVRIVDYKLGRKESYKKKTKAESLQNLLDAQLPMYLAAAIQHLPDFCAAHKLECDLERVWNESRAGYYSIRDTPAACRDEVVARVEIEEWPLDSLRSFADVSSSDPQALFQRVKRAVTQVLSGKFPVEPQDCKGAHCPARHSCRYVALPALEGEEG